MKVPRLVVLALLLGMAASGRVTIAVSGVLPERLVQQSRSPLSIKQVEGLIAIGTPDAAVAAEIRQRGIAFEVDDATITRLQKNGAGKMTVGALTALIPQVPLLVQTTPPEADVYLDGRLAGRSSRDGSLRIETRAGSHRLAGKKALYKDSPSLDIVARREPQAAIPIVLEWTGGYLTVTTNLSDADVEVETIGHFRGSIVKMPCLTRGYAVAVSAPYAVTQTRTVNVIAGEEATVNVSLTLDPAVLSPALAKAEMAIEQERYDSAVAVANAITGIDPTYPEGLATLASALFHMSEFPKFSEVAERALRQGGRIRFLLAHYHDAPAELHPVRVWVGPNEFAFDPVGPGACTFKRFSVPLANVVRMKTGDPNYVELTIRDEKNKTHNMRLAERHARLENKERTAAGVLTYRTWVITGRPVSPAALAAFVKTIALAREAMRK